MSKKSETSRAKSTAVLSTMVLLGIFAAFTPNTLARYSGGTGEPNDPYRIATAEDLNDIGNYEEDWNKHFILVNDVNLAEYTGTQFKLIGRFAGWSPTDKPFTGVFDGNDHKVRNFTWRSIDSNGIGLFGYLGEGGQIKNLGMENVDVNATTGRFVGGLVINNSGTITNCYLTGSIDGNDFVGSLVGLNYGTITDCYSAGSVSGKHFVGGLAGFNGGTITDCHSTASISQTPGNRGAGGLVAHNSGMITNCYSTGAVSGDWKVGGLVGDNFGMTTYCYSTASVTGVWGVGGLAGGNMWDGTISNSYSTGSVSGVQDVGGFVGANDRGYITHSYSTVRVTGKFGVGGLVGNHAIGEVSNSFWDIETSDCNTSAGGIGKTTAEMKTIKTFTEDGWDFVEVWGIGENQTYPYLRTEPAGDFNYDKKVNLIDLAILASHWLEEH